jgi:predicted SnoaL-like aldol condensation-catalyzing enzyme
MTTARDMVTAFMQALETKDFDGAASYLSDDFYFSGSMPRPLNKDQFIKFFQELARGIPNISFHVHDVHEVEENDIGSREVATIQMTGHQVNAINLYQLSLPIIPQMGKSVSLPEEHWEYVVRGNAIAAIDAEHVPGGGVAGLLHQLGVDAWIIS